VALRFSLLRSGAGWAALLFDQATKYRRDKSALTPQLGDLFLNELRKPLNFPPT
jgi:hypothetical protein